MENVKKPLFKPETRLAVGSILKDLYPDFRSTLSGSDAGFNPRPDIRLISNKNYFSLLSTIRRGGFFKCLWKLRFSDDYVEIYHSICPTIPVKQPIARLNQNYSFFCRLFDALYMARLKHYRRRTKKKKKTDKETP